MDNVYPGKSRYQLLFLRVFVTIFFEHRVNSNQASVHECNNLYTAIAMAWILPYNKGRGNDDVENG